MKLCRNGQEWAKRQLAQEGSAFAALDNGFLCCADPARRHTVCASLSATDSAACFARWLDRIPLPVTATDHAAGYGHRLSLRQLALSRTQVFADPQRGRECFEAVIRDQLDLGRPDRVHLRFERTVTRATPGRFRTRVVTDGVAPSLHVAYQRCPVKQYVKEGRALRTETPCNDPQDVGVKKGLSTFASLRTVGQRITTRLLPLESVAHDCGLASARLADLTQPSQTPEGQPAPGLKFGDPRVTAVLAAVCLFVLPPEGLTNRRLRPLVADLLAGPDDRDTARQMGYDRRRLARKGFIARVPGKLCSTLTPYGRRCALFLTKVHARILRPGFQALDPQHVSQAPPSLRAALEAVDAATETLVAQAHLAP